MTPMHSDGTTLVDFHPLTRPRLLRPPRSAPLLEILLENEGLARAGRRLDDDVIARRERANRLRLPRIGQPQLLQRFKTSHPITKGRMATK